MRVCQLKLSQFRNYAALDLHPGAGINILHGDNAQGKSNVLEAISLLATTRSLRASRESELILRDGEVANVNAEIGRDREGDVELQVSVFQGDKKAVRVNGLKRPRVVDLLGEFNAVFFGSMDLTIVTGEPTDRRHYLNVEISQISPRYVYDLGHYKRALAQRNRVLRDLRDRPRPPEASGIEAWTEQLVTFGSTLFDKRRFYTERLAPLADQIHRELTEGRESLELRYLPSIVLPPTAPPIENRENNLARESREERYVAETQEAADESSGESITQSRPESPLSGAEAIAAAFRQQLQAIGAEEARRGATLLGPQRDDMGLFINGMEARLYGSQGQQRTVALALKLAEFRLIEDYVGEPPVLLLDDVMSDLDDQRRAHLLQYARRRCQTFITCTNLRSFPKEILAEAATFHVANGVITADPKRKTKSLARVPPAPSEADGESAETEPPEPAAEPSENPV